ncbi:MAG: M1 family metallopeptidase [Chloroflexi bacterium]|nr:M1 family metallopeptidase [Chloroflexota bacterium]
MKKLLPFLLALSLLAVSCQFPSPSPAPTPLPTTDPSQPFERSLFREGLIEESRPILEKLQGASEYRLEFEIAADLLNVTGREIIHYTNNEDMPLDEVQLRLFPNLLGGRMQVTNLVADGKAVTPVLTLNDSLMSIPLPTPLEPGQHVTLGMDFSLTVPDTVELNYGVLAYAEGVLTLAHSYPMAAVYDDEGWNAEIPPQSGDLTYADISFFDVTVTAPKDLTLVAVGREMGRQVEGEQQIVRYAAGPVRDFYLVVSDDFESISREIGETTVNFYAPADLQSGAEAGLETAIRALEDFNARYGTYPYTELDLVTTPTLALGIEYPGMIAITERIMDPKHDYLESVVAHEVGHQWFYNLVGNDQLDDPWLDESLTQFITLQYFEDEYGSNGYQGYRASLTQRWQRVDNKPIPVGLPVADYNGAEYSAIVYGRGALFFEALRKEMGIEVFDAFLREYTETYAWDIATPQGLKSLAEARCGCDLTPLFDEWIDP